MDEHEGQEQAPTRPAARRLRALPGSRATSPVDYPGSDLPRPVLSAVGEGADAPRVAALDALLKDVDDLRATVRRDLGLAATAVSAGEPGFAAFLLDQSADDLRDFEGRSEVRLTDLDSAPSLPAAVGDDLGLPVGLRPRHRRLAPAAPLVAAAAALFVGLSGGLPALTGQTAASSSSAAQSFASLQGQIDAGASADQLGATADSIHDELLPLLATAGSDPEAAQAAIDLLTRETDVLLRSADTDHPEVQEAIRDAQALVQMLKRAVRRPTVKPPSVPPVPVQPPAQSQQETAKPAAKPTSSPSSKPSPTSSPSSKPTSSPSSKPTSSPSSSPSSTASEESSDNPLDPDLG